MTEGHDFEAALDRLENAFTASASVDHYKGTIDGDEYHEARNAARTMYRARVPKLSLQAWLGMWREHIPHEAVLELQTLLLQED